ncbi:MAG: DMT family transporter [Anaerolineales bacterium]|jgi:drug/metabolite transporter (DMT)-like permease
MTAWSRFARERLWPTVKPSRAAALREAILANIIWSSSFVLVKLAMAQAGPFTIGGVRYTLGFLILLPILLSRKSRPRLTRRHWLMMLVLGLAGYTAGNSLMYLSLYAINPTTASLILSLIPLPILFMGIFWLRETPGVWQVLGLVVCLSGSLLFLLPAWTPSEPTGLVLCTVGMLCMTLFGLLGRLIARDNQVETLALTALPLGFGGGLLLITALFVEGVPHLALGTWGLLLILGVFNTALAYLIYNHALQTLTALEINILFNLGPLGTALIAWPLLGDQLSGIQWVGMILVIAGIIGVQSGKAGTGFAAKPDAQLVSELDEESSLKPPSA